MKVTSFINLSGGVDSTYYLWRWLREHPNEIIVVHHCLFLARRLIQEKNACTNVLNYFRSTGLKNFRYFETGIQRGTLQGKILDIELLSANTGVALKLNPVDIVLLPYSKEETSALDNHLKAGGTIETYDHSHRYWKVNQIYELLAGKKFQYHFYRSLEDGGLLSKREMIQEMPKELFENTWYCRRPKEGDKVCGKCHTCRKVTRALEYIRNVKT